MTMRWPYHAEAISGSTLPKKHLATLKDELWGVEDSHIRRKKERQTNRKTEDRQTDMSKKERKEV